MSGLAILQPKQHEQYNKIVKEILWGQEKKRKVAKDRIYRTHNNGRLEILNR